MSLSHENHVNESCQSCHLVRFLPRVSTDRRPGGARCLAQDSPRERGLRRLLGRTHMLPVSTLTAGLTGPGEPKRQDQGGKQVPDGEPVLGNCSIETGF